jgi:hypothetical protein
MRLYWKTATITRTNRSPVAGTTVRGIKSMLSIPRRRGTLVAVHTASPAIVKKRPLAREASGESFAISLRSPTDSAVPSNDKVKEKSTAEVAAPRGSERVVEVHTGLNWGLCRTINAQPATKRRNTRIWMRANGRVRFRPLKIDKSMNCSRAMRAIWSKLEEKATATWQGTWAASSTRKAAKDVWAQRVAVIRNIARTSLGPSRKIKRPLALIKRKAVPDAAFRTRPKMKAAVKAWLLAETVMSTSESGLVARII